jgi:hypothetical protein
MVKITKIADYKASNYGINIDNLPELQGSEKQVKWANDIRDKVILNAKTAMNTLHNKYVQMKNTGMDLSAFDKVEDHENMQFGELEKAFNNDSAKYWIENHR